MFEEQLDVASASDEQVRQQIIQELASHPSETIDAITKGYHRKSRWKIAIQVIRAMGYPANSGAIPWLVDHIDRNSPAWAETVEAISELGPQIVIPHLMRAMWGVESRDSEWAYDVESICALLSALDKEFAVACVPIIIYLLSLRVDPRRLDPAFLLDVLEKAGADHTACAIPWIIDVWQRDSKSDVGVQAQTFLTTFATGKLEPYQLILDSGEASK